MIENSEYWENKDLIAPFSKISVKYHEKIDEKGLHKG